jgi:hypothetical protein
MRIRKIIYFFYIPLIFILCTCNDPVFYAISTEVKPIEPRISGVATNFVVYDGHMYVASGNALFSYKYNKDAGEDPDKQYWNKEASPGGNIIQIASTKDYLYALSSTDNNNDGKTILRRFDKDNSSWSQIGGILDTYAKIQNIFAAGGVLFVWAALSTTNYNYNLLYIMNGMDEALNVMDNQDDTGIITGAAFNGKSYFLPFTSRKKDKEKIGGVYKIDDINGGAKIITYKNAEGNELNVHFNGITSLGGAGNTVLMISRNGEVYFVDDSIVKIENVFMGRMSTGALAVYEMPPEQSDGLSNNPKRLLLAGRQDSLYFSSSSGYSYGYMELELDAAGIKSGANFTEPGRNPASSTLTDYERYQSSLGKYPVNYLFQAPPDIDSKMILFASTQKSGVWSCRDRDRNYGKYWNAEGEDEPKD